jgi:hypothetical protein
MGDSTKEVSEEDHDAAQMHKENANNAISEGMSKLFFLIFSLFPLLITIFIFYVTGLMCLTCR